MDKQNSKPPSDEHKETNVGGDVSESIVISGNGNVVNVGGGKPVKRRRRKAKPTPKKVNWSNPTIIVAVIGAVATIIAALLNSPLIIGQKEPTSTPTSSSTPTDSATATDYVTSPPIIVVVTSTEVTPSASPTFTLTPTLENTATASPSPEPEIAQMAAILQSTIDNGKAPLKVNFDARSSYVKFTDGSMAACGNNRFCSYVFAIYRDGNLVEKISNNNGLLSYTFGAKGKYWVTVYVCRGESCEDDGVEIAVK